MYMNINCISNSPNIFKHMIMSSQNSLPFQVALQSIVSFPTKKVSQSVSNNKLVINPHINKPIFVNDDKFVKILNPKMTPSQTSDHTSNEENLFSLNSVNMGCLRYPNKP